MGDPYRVAMLNEVKHLGPVGHMASEVETHLSLPGQILRVAQDDKRWAPKHMSCFAACVGKKMGFVGDYHMTQVLVTSWGHSANNPHNSVS